MIGTNLSTGYSEVFSHERQPNMPLAEALRISMSIPLFFVAKRYGPRKDVYVDGGVMLNYPITLASNGGDEANGQYSHASSWQRYRLMEAQYGTNLFLNTVNRKICELAN